jgi:hypothetical protein
VQKPPAKPATEPEPAAEPEPSTAVGPGGGADEEGIPPEGAEAEPSPTLEQMSQREEAATKLQALQRGNSARKKAKEFPASSRWDSADPPAEVSTLGGGETSSTVPPELATAAEDSAQKVAAAKDAKAPTAPAPAPAPARA